MFIAILTSRLAALRFLVRSKRRTLYRCSLSLRSAADMDSSAWVLRRSLKEGMPESLSRLCSMLPREDNSRSNSSSSASSDKVDKRIYKGICRSNWIIIWAVRNSWFAGNWSRYRHYCRMLLCWVSIIHLTDAVNTKCLLHVTYDILDIIKSMYSYLSDLKNGRLPTI